MELARLVEFWRSPVRFFLTRVLGLRLAREEAALEESEPFTLDRLEQFALRRETIDSLLHGRPAEQLFPALAATGRLPQPPFDRLTFSDLAADAAALAEPLHELLAEPRVPVAVDLALGPWQLTGQLSDLCRAGRVVWRSGARKAADLVELWVLHLALHLVSPPDLERRSTYLNRDRNGAPQWFVLGPVADPEPLLRDLLEGFRQGLTRPLPFYPETAQAWAAAADGRGRSAALRAWTSDEYHRGEDAQAEYAYFPGDRDPMDAAFVRQADLFRLILDHQES